MLLRRKASDLLTAVTDLEDDIFKKFCNQVRSEILLSLNKSILTSTNARVLSINYDKKVRLYSYSQSFLFLN